MFESHCTQKVSFLLQKLKMRLFWWFLKHCAKVHLQWTTRHPGNCCNLCKVFVVMYPTRLNFVRRIDRQGLKIIEFKCNRNWVRRVCSRYALHCTYSRSNNSENSSHRGRNNYYWTTFNCPSNTIGFCSFALLLCIFCRTESFTVDHLENEVIFLVLGTLPNSMCQRLTEAEHAK